MKINKLFIAFGFFSALSLYSADTLNFSKINVGESISKPFKFKTNLPITIEKIKSTKDIKASISTTATDLENANIEINATQNTQFIGAAFAFVKDDNGNRYSIPACINAEAHYAEAYDQASYNLYGNDLITALRTYLNSVHKSYSYKDARTKMFSMVDNYNGVVECVYSGRTITTNAIPDVTTTHFNTEHTWPQSYGAKQEPESSDINHMRPSYEYPNADRGNLRFGYVVKNAKDEGGGSKLGKDINDSTVFEIRDEYKGDIARGLFYFALKYGNKVNEKNANDKFLDSSQYRAMLQWHIFDKPSTKEIERNSRIKSVQLSENPFIEHPQIIERMNLIAEYKANNYFYSADSMIVFTNASSLPIYFYTEQNAKLEYAKINVDNNFTVSVSDSNTIAKSIYSFNIKHNISETPHNAELKVKFTNSDEYTIYLKSESTSAVNCINNCSNDISIYPNPSNGFTTVSINSNNNNLDLAKIELFDASGKIVLAEINKTINANNLQFRINLNNTNSNQLFFKLTIGNDIKSGIININK